jgi:virulence-associated protein VagC
LISADALAKLVELKEDAERQETAQRIRSILVPMEYTRLDGMIDVLFTTAKGTAEAAKETLGPVEFAPNGPTAPPMPQPHKAWQFTDADVLRALRERIIGAVNGIHGSKFLRKSGALYWTADHDSRLACTLSKQYEQKGASGHSYWYGYHETWDEFLEAGTIPLVVLGCVGASFAFAIPRTVFHSVLPFMDITERPTGKYWHVRSMKCMPMDGRLQAVRLPREYRFETDQVRIRRHGEAVILEPVAKDWAWLDPLIGLVNDAFTRAATERPTSRAEY